MNVLLNGLGRIGKSIFRLSLKSKNINIIAINELNNSIENLAYNINYDSTYGTIKDKFKAKNKFIKNGKLKVNITHQKDLTNLNLSNIDIIIDSSGVKQDIKLLNNLEVKHIILTHPISEIPNIILGVNDTILKNAPKVISTSSCNATALLPLLTLVDKKYTIINGDITTIHPLLNHQKLLDGNCIGSQNREVQCNFEFGRGSVNNIIPSATTTVKACSYIKPKYKDILTSSSLRVPTQTVGVINVVLFLEKNIDKDDFIKLCKTYENKQSNKIVLNNFESLVSSDFKAIKYTTILDHRYTQTNKNILKVTIWYDNEWGYASKVIEITKKLINLK